MIIKTYGIEVEQGGAYSHVYSPIESINIINENRMLMA